MKISPVEAELFHGGGRTDKQNETNSHFSQFCDSAKKIILRCVNENVGGVLSTLRTFKMRAADVHITYRLVQKVWPSSILQCIGFNRNTIGSNTGISKKARRLEFHKMGEFFV
jgi:hypothetical protein